jgi:hypothetical protein
MVKFSLSIKDEYSDVTIEGDSEKEVLDNLKNLKKLKHESDKELGFDIKIPNQIHDKMKSLEYAEQIMVLLYYKGNPMSRSELHDRNEMLFIKDSWWSGSNFTRDLGKKVTQKLMTKIEDDDPKYKLTATGVTFVRKNVLGNNND